MEGEGGRKQRKRGKVEEAGLGKERGVKFPSGFQLGRINSVLELTLTPSLPHPPPHHPPLSRPSTQGQASLSHSGGDGEGERLHYGHPFSDQSGRKWYNKSRSRRRARQK